MAVYGASHGPRWAGAPRLGAKKSIESVGQLEPIYVWRNDEDDKYLVLEGATRVVILRELARKHANEPKDGKFSKVKAKVLPAEFGETERVILLARIHVRGSGVRAWGRCTEAKFVYDNVTPRNGKKPLMFGEGAGRLHGKSASWVSRLKDAYEFARRFIEHVDADEAVKLAKEEFSTLEEISKARIIGPLLKDYDKASFEDEPGRGGTSRLPELELPAGFSSVEARRWAARIPSARVRTIVARELDRLLGPARPRIKDPEGRRPRAGQRRPAL